MALTSGACPPPKMCMGWLRDQELVPGNVPCPDIVVNSCRNPFQVKAPLYGVMGPRVKCKGNDSQIVTKECVVNDPDKLAIGLGSTFNPSKSDCHAESVSCVRPVVYRANVTILKVDYHVIKTISTAVT